VGRRSAYSDLLRTTSRVGYASTVKTICPTSETSAAARSINPLDKAIYDRPTSCRPIFSMSSAPHDQNKNARGCLDRILTGKTTYAKLLPRSPGFAVATHQQSSAIAPRTKVCKVVLVSRFSLRTTGVRRITLIAVSSKLGYLTLASSKRTWHPTVQVRERGDRF
jgi:hypothetical protein